MSKVSSGSHTALDSVWEALEARGCRGRIVPVEHLRDLQEEIEGHRRAGRLDEELYAERLASLRYQPPHELADARSLIVLAVPRPQTQAVFHSRGEPLPLILPPTYTRYRALKVEVTDLLAELLAPHGCRVAKADLPLKLLAVRSGLGAYGRNNVCYVEGMGSFLQLVAAYADLPCPHDPWREARMLERCQKCTACQRHCPSGAITEERFPLRAERCIVFHNEKPGTVPFPTWLDPSWHNCIEGCMHCQRVCPEDKPFWDWIEGTEEFSEEETSLLARETARERIPSETLAKLERLDLVQDLDIIPRNLGVFLSRAAAA